MTTIPNAIFYAPYFSVGHLFDFEYDSSLIKYVSLVAVFFGIVVFFEIFDKFLDRFMEFQHLGLSLYWSFCEDIGSFMRRLSDCPHPNYPPGPCECLSCRLFFK